MLSLFGWFGFRSVCDGPPSVFILAMAGVGRETRLRREVFVDNLVFCIGLTPRALPERKQTSENVGLIAFLYPSSKIALEFLLDLSPSPRPQVPSPLPGPHVPGPCVCVLQLLWSLGRKLPWSPSARSVALSFFFQSKFSNINYTVNYFSLPRAVNHALRGC